MYGSRLSLFDESLYLMTVLITPYSARLMPQYPIDLFTAYKHHSCADRLTNSKFEVDYS